MLHKYRYINNLHLVLDIVNIITTWPLFNFTLINKTIIASFKLYSAFGIVF